MPNGLTIHRIGWCKSKGECSIEESAWQLSRAGDRISDVEWRGVSDENLPLPLTESSLTWSNA